MATRYEMFMIYSKNLKAFAKTDMTVNLGLLKESWMGKKNMGYKCKIYEAVNTS